MGEKVFEDEFLVYNNKYQSSILLPLCCGVVRVAKLIYLWPSFQSNTGAVKKVFQTLSYSHNTKMHTYIM